MRWWPVGRPSSRSRLSSKARAVGPDALGGLPVTMVLPDGLVELTFAADRVLIY